MRRSSLAGRLLALSGVTAVALGLAVAAPGVASAAPLVLTVSTTSDSGTGSLRDAINQANSNPGSDAIEFALSGTTTIAVPGGASGSALPPITDPVTIDGFTQDPFATSPPIRVEATDSPDSIFSFEDGSEGSVLTGLDIASASGQAVLLGAVSINADAINVTNNRFGLNAAGDGEDDGLIQKAIDVQDDGDATATQAIITNNVIGSASVGIGLNPGTSSNTVSGNTLGMIPDRTATLPMGWGVVADSSDGTSIGNNNVGVADAGIEVIGGSDLYVGQNLVGIMASGDPSAITSSGSGVYLHDGVTNATVTQNEVASYFDGIRAEGGATVTGTIDHNTLHQLTGAGIRFAGSTAMAATRNSIYDTANGIKHGFSTAPSPQNAGGGPTLSNITDGSGDVDLSFSGPGSFASQDVTVEFFLSSSCNPSGYGDGQTYLTSGTMSLDANAQGATTVTLGDNGISFAAGDHVTATITPQPGAGSTTEFSNCFTVPAGPVNHEPFTVGADPNPASVGLNDTVDITLTGSDQDGDPLTFALPGGGSTLNSANGVTLVGSPSCDGSIPSTCTQVARYHASTPFLGSDVFTWTVDDGTATAPAASAQVDVVNAGLRVTNVLWLDAGYVAGSQTALQAFAVNDGPDAAHNTTMTVSAPGGGALPAGVSLASGNGINDAVDAGSCTESAGVITCPIGDLQSLGLAGIDLTLTTSGATPDPLVVEVAVSSDTPDSDLANNAYTSPGLPAVAAGTADLAVSTLVDSPDPVTAGGDVQYTTTITNNGPDDATGVQVKLNGDSSSSLPSFTSFVSGTAGVATCTSTSGGPVLCPVGTVASGDSVAVTIYLQADAVSSSTTTPVQVSVTSSSTDPNGANDSSSTSTTINPVTGGDTTVYVPPSTEPQTVATGQTVVLRGDVIPVATSADPVGAAVTVPPDGPGGVVTIEEQACTAPFRCPGEPRTGTQPAGTLIAGTVTQIVPPDADFYDFSHPLTYTLTYDKTTFSPTSRIRVYYVKDSAPDVLVRARSCGTLSATTVFPCLKGVKILKSPDLDVRGDLRVRLLATWDDPKIGTYKG